MDFLKKHYEKILLGVMLFGLIGVLVFMIFYISAEKSDMATKSIQLVTPHPKPLPALDTTAEDAAISRLKAPYNLDFESTNKLFNPMEWQRALDSSLILASKTGAQVAVVTNIAPLYFVVSLDSVIANETATNYVIKIERQAATTAAKRAPTRHYVSNDDKKPKSNDPFALETVKGPLDNPAALVLKLTDTQEEITVTRDAPYRRIDGYTADFRYDPERKVFRGRRVNDKVSFGGVDYTVVEINQNELILMDQSNQKKTSLRFVP
jgi:hypothetical protein